MIRVSSYGALPAVIGSGVDNRLSSVLKNGSPLANFYYNALGERLRKETPATGGNRLYQYGDNGQLLSEHFINGQGRHYKTRNYIWLGSLFASFDLGVL